jgi:hypothetical protein
LSRQTIPKEKSSHLSPWDPTPIVVYSKEFVWSEALVHLDTTSDAIFSKLKNIFLIFKKS